MRSRASGSSVVPSTSRMPQWPLGVLPTGSDRHKHPHPLTDPRRDRDVHDGHDTGKVPPTETTMSPEVVHGDSDARRREPPKSRELDRPHRAGSPPLLRHPSRSYPPVHISYLARAAPLFRSEVCLIADAMHRQRWVRFRSGERPGVTHPPAAHPASRPSRSRNAVAVGRFWRPIPHSGSDSRYCRHFRWGWAAAPPPFAVACPPRFEHREGATECRRVAGEARTPG